MGRAHHLTRDACMKYASTPRLEEGGSGGKELQKEVREKGRVQGIVNQGSSNNSISLRHVSSVV